MLGVEKLEWWCDRVEKEVWRYLQPSGFNTRTWRTDGRTDSHRATADIAVTHRCHAVRQLSRRWVTTICHSEARTDNKRPQISDCIKNVCMPGTWF